MGPARGVGLKWRLGRLWREHAAASTKLRAADMVLTHGAKAIEIEDIEARVAALEQAAEVAKQSR